MSHTVRKGAYAFPNGSEFFRGFRRGVLSGLDAETVLNEVREWKMGECTLNAGRCSYNIRLLAMGGLEVTMSGDASMNAVLIPSGSEGLTAWCAAAETPDAPVRCRKAAGRMIADLIVLSRACECCPWLVSKGGEKA